MSKRNTLAGKKARRDARITRLNQTGIFHPIAGMQSAAPRQGKKNKYEPRRNTPKAERESFKSVFVTVPAQLELGLGHALRPRKGVRR